MDEEVKLSAHQQDGLKEIANIGSGHAALALGQLIGERINIGVVRVEVVPTHEFNVIVGGPNVLGAVVYLQTLGEMKGGILLFFKREDALRVMDTLLHREKGKTVMLSEIGISALKEAGNILSGSYLSAMSQMVHFKLALSTPKFAFDLVKFIMDGVLSELLAPEKKCLALVTEFIESTHQIKGYFVFLPRKETLEAIVSELE